MKNMNSIDEIKIAWKEEYDMKGIPSSFRRDPSKPLVEFIAWLKDRKDCSGHLAADIGCGRGRNSFYLASQGFTVKGIELLEDNVNAINRKAKQGNLPIEAYAQNVTEIWPLASNSLDLAIDVFCYKHVNSKQKQSKYRRELWRALKSTGFYFISLASENDGFYGPLLEKSTNPEEKLVMDPYSNIFSFLYSQEDLIKEFSDSFEIIEISEQTSSSPMYGLEYPRQVINAIFKKLT